MGFLGVVGVYAGLLLGSFQLWNRQLYGALSVFVVLALVGLPLSGFFGLAPVYAICYPVELLLSLCGWWYSTQLVKHFTERPRVCLGLSVSLLLMLQLLLVFMPMAVWGDWKVGVAVLLISWLTGILAGSEATDRFVTHRAARIMDEDPDCSWEKALARAEREVRWNVNSDLLPQ